MKNLALYVAITAPFFVLPLALEPLGVPFDDGQALSILALIAAGGLGTIYIDNLYLHQTQPRSVFFGMLVASLNIAAAVGIWIGYLIARSRLAEWFAITLPAPDQPARGLVTGIGVVLLLATPVYFAVSIALKRRAVRRSIEYVSAVMEGRERP